MDTSRIQQEQIEKRSGLSVQYVSRYVIIDIIDFQYFHLLGMVIIPMKGTFQVISDMQE